MNISLAVGRSRERRDGAASIVRARASEAGTVNMVEIGSDLLEVIYDSSKVNNLWGYGLFCMSVVVDSFLWWCVVCQEAACYVPLPFDAVKRLSIQWLRAHLACW